MAFTAIMTAIAVVLSALSVPFVFGLRIHFFQVAIMLAGVIGGPVSGLIAGSVGGVYMSALRSDPTIIVGNAFLGLFTGLFVRKMRPCAGWDSSLGLDSGTLALLDWNIHP